MKNNKRVTLKALQKELELLKAQSQIQESKTVSEVAGHDIKGSYINRIYMKSSMFMLYVITGILSYAHKIPFISRIITILALWYGRTTWWRLLVYSRKIFVIFNAIIGVFVVFTTVGFSTDNILAGFTALGGQYLEILYSLSKRLFNWFFDLFDHKIVPNTPSNPTSFNKWNPLNRIGWNTKPMHDSGFDQLRELYKTQDFYKSPISLNVNTSSWWDSSWLWYLVLGVSGVAVLYFGYKFCFDPNFIENLFGESRARGAFPNSDTINEDIPDIKLTEATSSSASIASAVTNAFRRITSSITHPFHSFFVSESTNRRAYRDFIESQFNNVTQNRNYYPFTTYNPYAPWYTNLRLRFFGETAFESMQRFKDHEFADRVYNSLAVGKDGTKVLGGTTPIAASMGIGTPNPAIHSNLVWDQVQSVIHTSTAIKHAPSTPIHMPITTDILPDIEDWKNHQRDAFDPNWKAKLWENLRAAQSNVASSSNVTLEDIPDYNLEQIFGLDTVDDEVGKVAELVAEFN
jgi:hypothetical protein